MGKDDFSHIIILTKKYIMNYPFEIQRVPAFLGTKNITHLFQDQYFHQ